MAVELNFETFVRDLQDIGFYNYFLPFILIFAITYALLENSKILGEKKNVNVVISMAIGLILIVQQGIVETINSFLQKSSLIIVIALVALLIIFLVGGESRVKKGFGFGVIVIVIIIALIWALSPDLGLTGIPIWSDISDSTKNLILMLLIFLIIPIILVSKKQTGGGFGKGVKDFIEGIGNTFNERGENK